MATLEDFLRYGTTTRVNATRPQPAKPAVIRQRDALNQLYETSLATGQVTQPEVGGWRGLVSDIMESPIGGAILGAANVIDIPRRAVVSVIKEAKDAFDSDPNTKASWDELTSQINDPTFGFGDVTGNLFGESGAGMFFNRIVGFAGDVLLDPTTYLTLGGGRAIKYGADIADEVRQSARVVAKAQAGRRGVSIGGKEGRFALAKRLADVGASDDVVAKAARYGRPAVKDPDLLAKAGVNRAGLYFMGRRIPLTTAIGESLEGGFSKLRTWSGDTIFKKPSAVFTPEDANAARIALARGTVPPQEGADFIRFVLSRNNERSAQEAEKRVAQIIRNEMLGALPRTDIEEARGTAYKLMDYSDRAANNAGLTADERVAGAAHNFLQRLINNVKEAMLKLDPEAPVNEIQMYFPHMPSEQAYRWMSNAQNPDAVRIMNLLYNPLDNTGAFRSRMREGDEFFGHTLTKQDVEGGVDRLNEIAINSGKIGFQFFETDLPTVLDRYIDMYAAQMGRISRRKYLADTGVLERIQKRELLDTEKVKELSKTVNKLTSARGKAMNDSTKKFDEIIDYLDKTATEVAEAGLRDIDEGMDTARQVLRSRVSLSQVKQQLTRDLESIHASLSAHADLYARILGDKPLVVSVLEDEYKAILDRIDVLREANTMLNSPIDSISSEISELSDRITKLSKTEDLLKEQGHVLQRYIDDIIDGKDIDKVGKGRSEMIRKAIYGRGRGAVTKEQKIFGVDAQPLDSGLWDEVSSKIVSGKKGGKPGVLTPAKRDMIIKEYSARGGDFGNAESGARGTRWWMESTKYSDIAPSKVEDMAAGDNLNNLVQRSLRGEASITELRVAALALLSTSDSLPKGLADELKKVLVDADAADDFYTKLMNQSRDRTGMFSLEQTLNNWVRVERQVSDSLRQHYAASKMLDAIHGVNDVGGAYEFNPMEVVPRALLERIAAQDEFRPIAYLFDDYIDDAGDIESLANMTTVFDKSEFAEIGTSGFKVSKGTVGEMGGDIKPRNELTFGEMDRILRQSMKEVEDLDFEVSFSHRQFGKEAKEVATEVIYLKNLLNKTTKTGRTFRQITTLDELEEFISDAVTGSAKKVERPAGVIGLGERLDMVPAISELRSIKSKYPVMSIPGHLGMSPEFAKFIDGGPAYASIGEDLEIVKRAIGNELVRLSKAINSGGNTDALENLFDVANKALRDVDAAITSIRAATVPGVSKSRGARILRGNEEIFDVSIRGEIEAIQEQLESIYGATLKGTDSPYSFERGGTASEVRRARADVAGGRGGAQGVKTAKRTVNERVARESTDEVKRRLEKALQDAWFVSEITSRFSRLSDALFKIGLAPDKDALRKVINVVAKDKADAIARDNLMYIYARRDMGELLDEIGDPAAWDGRTDELYELILRRLNPTNKNGEAAEWSGILRTINGRSDASRMLATLRHYGGYDGNSGVPLKRRKLRSQLRQRSISVEERAALEAELASLPDNAALNKSKKKFLEENLRPWYRAHIDASNEKPSLQEIQAALLPLSKVKAGGGRLAEDASAREMISWVRESVERIDSALNTQSKSASWITAAADPFFIAHRAEDVLIAGQDVPSMYAGLLLGLANQYETAANNFRAQITRAVRKGEELEEVLPIEAPAVAKKQAMEAGVGDKAPTLKSISADEAERKALEQARKARRELVELQNTDEWLAAVERNQLNELLKVFAAVSIDGEDKIVIRSSPKKEARRLFNAGEKIYVLEQGDGRIYREVANVEDIVDGKTYWRREINAGIEDYKQIGRGQPRTLRWSDELDELDEAGKVIKNGGMLRLTKAELDSLFLDPKEFASRRASLRAAYDAQVREVDNEIVKVESRIQKIRLDIKQASGATPKMRGSYTARRQSLLNIESLQREITSLEDMLRELRMRRSRMSFTSYSNELMTRDATLQKMSGLLQLIKRGDYTMDEIRDGLSWMSRGGTNTRLVDDTVRQERITFLDDIWESSSDSRIFNKVRELEFSEQMARFNATMADYDRAIATVSKYRTAAAEAWRFTPEEGAPYGREWSIGKYSAAKRAGKSDEEAREAARLVRGEPNDPQYRQPRNVQEARYRASAIDERTRGELRKITAATRGQYDAEARWDQLLDAGVPYYKAAQTINDEIRALRPSDEALFISASLEKSTQEIEYMRNRIGFFNNSIDSTKQWWWNTSGYGQELQALTMRLGEVQSELGDALVSWDIYKSGLLDYVTTRAKSDVERLTKLESDILDVSKLVDQSAAGYEDAQIWFKWTKGMLERRVQKAEAILASNEIVRKGAAGGMSAAERAEFMDWVDQMITVLDDMNVSTDALVGLRADYLNAHSVLMGREDAARDALKALEDLKDLKWGAKIVDEDIRDGMVALTKIGMPSYAASQRIAEFLENASRMREPEFVRGLNRFMGRYTGYFKAGAVGTPGFVVRNTISNTFSLVSMGASPENMVDGLKYYAQWRSAYKAGRESEWLASLSDEAREIVDLSIKSMDASGFGRSEEALAGWAPKRKWLIDNAVYRKIRSWNEVSESSVRFIAAYDSLAKGASYDQAVAQVKRYFFDYVDVSKADITLRSVIPFWFWMSRNLPLQIVNQWTHPRAYQQYRSFQRNFGSEPGEDEVVPIWLQGGTAIRMGEGTYLSPDLPFSRIAQQFEEFKDPKRLLKYVNPGIRVPFEVLLSSKRLYNDTPFSDEPQTPVGGPLSPAVQAFAELLGQGRPTGFGERGVTDQVNYAMMNLFPQLGQLERAMPVTDLYKDRQMNSLRSLLGIPVVEVTDSMIQSELRRRRREGQ